MKKITILCCTLLSACSAFAYGSSYSDALSGFATFTLIVMIAYIILSIVILVRWWKMTTNVDQIRQRIVQDSPRLTYLVAIGEKEQAQKAALKMLVDTLYPIYSDPYNYAKAETMNREIQVLLPKIQMLGLAVPEYVTTGEKFIDYINGLIGAAIPYKSDPSANTTN